MPQYLLPSGNSIEQNGVQSLLPDGNFFVSSSDESPVSIAVEQGVIAAFGLAPTVFSVLNITIAPLQGTVVATGSAPSIFLSLTLPVPQGSVSMLGALPTLALTGLVVAAPPTARLRIQGRAPVALAGNIAPSYFSDWIKRDG